MRVEVTPPEIDDPKLAAEATKRIQEEIKFEGHALRFKMAILTLKDKRKEFRDITELEAIWSLVDGLEP